MCRMCSNGVLNLILLIVLINNCVFIADSINTFTTTTPKTATFTISAKNVSSVDTTSATWLKSSLGSNSHQSSHIYVRPTHHDNDVDDVDDDDDEENILLHASAAHAPQPQAAHHTDETKADGRKHHTATAGGQFIDITRKHKIHYNGIVIDENNLMEHLADHERELIFGKSRKKRSIKLVHLTYRPVATTPTNSHPTDDTPMDGENELELQIPNNTLEATTKALHRYKRSDNEPAPAATAATSAASPSSTASSSSSPLSSSSSSPSSLPKRQGGDAPPLPTVSVQIKDNDHLVNLRLQQTSKLIDDAFIFIRRYANSSQLVENSHKLAERLEKCFYHNENAALDLCDDANVRGVFHHNRTDFSIHPLPARFGANNTHIILESEAGIYDSLWTHSMLLNETIQFEPDLEDFNDVHIDSMLQANSSTTTTTRSTRNIETDALNTQPNQFQQEPIPTNSHHKHRIPLNLRYKPKHHHHHQQHQHHQHHQHQHLSSHQTLQLENVNHHAVKRHHHLLQHNKKHHPSAEQPKMSKRSRRFISSAKQWRNSDVLHIETAIFVDTDLYKHMAKNFPTDTSAHLIRFVLAMINSVQLLYHHPSLGRRVSFVLKRLEILEKDPLDLVRSTDIDIYLSNFCKWQTKWNPPKDSDPMHYDHAVILTGLDLYVVNKNGKMISQVVGLAPVGGMCMPTSSCTINEGKHFESVFVVAHEIGHNLGMRHDTTDNSCDPTSHIMSPTLGSGKITWSKCSKDSLNAFLEKDQAACLFNRAEFSYNLDHSAEGILPGERFNADQQCMLKYGKESKRALSQAISDICRDLHCQRDRYTWTSHPALEGTACGDNMWCHSGFCVMRRSEAYVSSKQTLSQTKANYDKSSFMDHQKASNLLHAYQKPSSSWSEWSEPGQCDSSCLYGPSKRLREGSTGLRTFTRKCVDYKRRCMGRDRKFETCVAKQCYSVPIITISEFARQVCERAQKFDNDLTGEGEQITGDIEESCKVFCKTKSNGTKSRSWTFPDGTTCRSKFLANDEPAYCIQGRCEKFSCDNSTANYYKIDNIFCKQQEKANDNSMDNETVRRSSTQQSYSNHIPVGAGQSSQAYNTYDRYDNYRNANPNYYDRGGAGGDDRIYGPTTVRSRYENEVAARPYHGQFNHDSSAYKRKSDLNSPWNKYSYHLNDHMPPSDPLPPKSQPVNSIAHASSSSSSGENEWMVQSGCHSSCMARSKGIQVIVNRRTGVRNIQLCTHGLKPCDRLQTAAEFADHTCSRYKLKVRGLSGHGTQIAASVEDPDRSCRVGCQDEFINHRFYLVNGNYGHFPLGTRCSNAEERYCVRGKCLEFGADQIPLQQSHISLALFRSRRSARKHRGLEQHVRNKRSFLYYDPVNITETLTQEFINNIVNSIITLEEKQIKDDSLLDDHIEFTNPIHYSMSEPTDK